MDNLLFISEDQARELLALIPHTIDIIQTVTKHCEMINELNDTMLNANLEHLRRHIYDMHVLVYKLQEFSEILTFVFFST
jgi:mRNA-degrading endonuclease YafQ of YafQ-DinJ toxin-antitoxin module